MSHTMPVQATFNVMKYFNITPSITLNDRMYTSKIRQQWDPNASAVVRDTSYSFYNIFDFNFSLSLSTKIYGFFKPFSFLGKLSEKLQMVRHVITPTISFSASPDFSDPFWGYYGNYERPNSNGGELERVKYSYFQHGLYGNATQGKSGTVSFNIANNLEAKIKSDNDSTGYKKISLIENFTLSQSCNLAADSMKWSNLNTSIMLRLVKGFNLNLSATWDVYKYALNESGTPVRVNKLRLFNGGGWGRLSSTGTSFSYTFNNDTFRRKGNKDNQKNDNPPRNNGNRELEEDKDHQDEDGRSGHTTDLELIDGYAKWDCPWSLTLNYSLSYGYGTFNYDKLEYNGKWTQNLSMNASIRPTKNWSFTASASYNFDTHKIAYMNCSISRQMHCLEMSASFVPVGPYKSYNFHIAVKSSILQDVKYDKHSSMNNGVTWYLESSAGGLWLASLLLHLGVKCCRKGTCSSAVPTPLMPLPMSPREGQMTIDHVAVVHRIGGNMDHYLSSSKQTNPLCALLHQNHSFATRIFIDSSQGGGLVMWTFTGRCNGACWMWANLMMTCISLAIARSIAANWFR